MGSAVETNLLDLSLVGFGMQLYHPNPTSPRQFRLRIDNDPSYGYKRLRLTGEELSRPPQTIWKLKELEFLDLSPGANCDCCVQYHLSRLPPDVSKLVNLRILCLDTNKLSEIPGEVGLLHNLERLILSNNQLTTLPLSLQGLEKLCSLHMANNCLEEIPKVVFSLKNLQFLDASDNQITHLAPEISSLTNLESLLLMCNQLESIPDSIGECLRLKTLWLAMNRLRELPRSIGNLIDLDWAKTSPTSNLEGNPITQPPMEICKKGPLMIEEYFRNKELLAKIMLDNKTPIEAPEDTTVVLESTIPLEPSLQTTAKSKGGKQRKGGFLPDASPGNSRSPSSTSSSGKRSAARNSQTESVRSNARSSPAVALRNNAWMTSPNHDGKGESQSRNSHLISRLGSPIKSRGNSSRGSRMSLRSPYTPISPAASRYEPRSAASQRRSATRKTRGKTPKKRDPSKSVPDLTKPIDREASRASFTSVDSVGRAPSGMSAESPINKRTPSRYSDYIKEKAWKRYEQVTRSLPTSAGNNSRSAKSQDLNSSTRSEPARLIKMTPMYDFKDNNGSIAPTKPKGPKTNRSVKPASARSLDGNGFNELDGNDADYDPELEDLEVFLAENGIDLKLQLSPKNLEDKENSFSLFDISPRAPTKPKGPKTRRSAKTASARSYKPEQDVEDNFADNRIDLTLELSSRQEGEIERNADEEALNADPLPETFESNINGVGDEEKENTTDGVQLTNTEDVPLIVTANGNGESHQPLEAAHSPQPLNEAHSPKPVATQKTPTTVKPRRRGYVVEKRQMARRKRNKHPPSGRSSKAKKTTLGTTLAVAERPDTELTFFGQGERAKEKEDGNSAESPQVLSLETEHAVSDPNLANEDDLERPVTSESRKNITRTPIKKTRKARRTSGKRPVITANKPRNSPLPKEDQDINNNLNISSKNNADEGTETPVNLNSNGYEDCRSPTANKSDRKLSGKKSRNDAVNSAEGDPVENGTNSDKDFGPDDGQENIPNTPNEIPRKFRSRPSSNTSTPSDSSVISANGKRVRSSRKRKPKSNVNISRLEEFEVARDIFGPVLCRDCELKHLIQAYKDSIKPM